MHPVSEPSSVLTALEQCAGSDPLDVARGPLSVEVILLPRHRAYDKKVRAAI